MLLRMQSFTESLEQIGEAAVVILLGGLLRSSMLTGGALILAPLLFFLIRPASVFASMAGSGIDWAEQSMMAWFGIRGMASVYYLAYIYGKGAPDPLVHQLAEIALGVVAYSILLHGISVTPWMSWFEKRSKSSA
jgi:sodium/hydrogen antiporter